MAAIRTGTLRAKGHDTAAPGRLIGYTRVSTDQHGTGQRVAVHANPSEPGCCPAAALEAWLRHRREAHDLDWTASAAMRAGLDSGKYSGHSLRRGLLTAGADNRANLAELMRQSRHRSAQSVLGYLEPADLWRNNVTEGVFRQQQDRESDGGIK